MASKLEDQFLALWLEYGDGSVPIRQHMFAHHVYFVNKGKKWARRRWAFDFAFVDERVAVEIEGGAFKLSGHTSGMGYTDNASKYNQAALDGWLLLRYTTWHLTAEPLVIIAQVKQALEMRRAARLEMGNCPKLPM